MDYPATELSFWEAKEYRRGRVTFCCYNFK